MVSKYCLLDMTGVMSTWTQQQVWLFIQNQASHYFIVRERRSHKLTHLDA